MHRAQRRKVYHDDDAHYPGYCHPHGAYHINTALDHTAGPFTKATSRFCVGRHPRTQYNKIDGPPSAAASGRLWPPVNAHHQWVLARPKP